VTAILKNRRTRHREQADLSRTVRNPNLFLWFGSTIIVVTAMSHEAKFSFVALPEQVSALAWLLVTDRTTPATNTLKGAQLGVVLSPGHSVEDIFSSNA
jgi:hypothetical protein